MLYRSSAVLPPSPEVHGVRVELPIGEVVERAVVERLEDEVELVVRGHPGLEPELVADLKCGGGKDPLPDQSYSQTSIYVQYVQ